MTSLKMASGPLLATLLIATLAKAEDSMNASVTINGKTYSINEEVEKLMKKGLSLDSKEISEENAERARMALGYAVGGASSDPVLIAQHGQVSNAKVVATTEMDEATSLVAVQYRFDDKVNDKKDVTEYILVVDNNLEGGNESIKGILLQSAGFRAHGHQMSPVLKQEKYLQPQKRR